MRRMWRYSANLGLACFLSLFLIYFIFALFPDEPWSTPIVFKNRVGEQATPASFNRKEREEGEVILLFGGDIMQHRGQMSEDYLESYSAIAQKIQKADLAAANLEFPVNPRKPVGPGPYSARFNGAGAHLQALAQSGWDVLFTANNHAFDEGSEGFRSTLTQIRRAGMVPVGTAFSQPELDSPTIISAQSMRIALFAYTYDINVYEDSAGNKEWPPKNLPIFTLNFDDWSSPWREQGIALFRRHTEQARRAGAQFVIGYCHWGQEWNFLHTADQQLAAHDMVDAGFDLVVGSHAHVVQGCEIYGGRLISYSLGNLNSDFAPWEARTGALLEVALTSKPKAQLAWYCYDPIIVHRAGHRVTFIDPSDDSEAEKALDLVHCLLGHICNPK